MGLAKFKKIAMGLLPKSVLHKVIRSQINLLPAYENKKFVIKLATTQEELESAYELLHDAYVNSGLMDRNPSNLRVSLFTALPFTSVIIAKNGSQVVGTVSLIKDSPIGLPSDHVYQEENNRYRSVGQSLVEVSALAVHPDYRRKESGNLISLMLMYYLHKYAGEFMGCSVLVATVHPRAVPFYEALFNFKKNGTVVKYQAVKESLASHITMDLKITRQWMEKKTSHLPRKTNLFSFYYQSSFPYMQFPKGDVGVLLRPVMTPSLLEYFFVKRTNLLSQLKRQQLEMIKSAYSLHFDLNSISIFKFIALDKRQFRYSTNIKAMVSGQEATVFDLSLSGLYLATNMQLELGKMIDLNLNIENKKVAVKGRVIRGHSQVCDRFPKGYGIALLEESLDIYTTLKKSHCNRSANDFELRRVAGA